MFVVVAASEEFSSWSIWAHRANGTGSGCYPLIPDEGL